MSLLPGKVFDLEDDLVHKNEELVNCKNTIDNLEVFLGKFFYNGK